MNYCWVDSSADQVAKIMSREVRSEVLSLWLNLGPSWMDCELGGGLTENVPCVFIGSHVGPPPPLHALNSRRGSRQARHCWLRRRAFPVLMTRVGEAPNLAQS